MTDNSNPDASNEQPGVIVKDNAARIASVRTSGPEGAPMSVATSKGVLATATDERMGGLGRHGLSEQHTRVKVGNLELSLGEAVAHGYVVKTADGSYKDVSAEEAEASREAAERFEEANRDPDEIEVGLDEAGTRVVADMASAIEEAGFAVPQVVSEFLSDPSRIPEGLARAAIARGEDVKETFETLRSVAASYAAFVDSKLVSVGVPQSMLGDFAAWVSEPQRQQYRTQAVLELLHTGSIKPWLTLGREYMASSRPGKQAQAAADRRDPIGAREGVSVSVDARTGERFVRLPNGAVTSEAAARRAGLI